MAYIDSNVFIYPIIYDPEAVPEANRSKALLLEVATGGIEAHTASITWDEVVWAIRRLLGPDISLDRGRRLLSFPNLRFLAVKRGTVAKAQGLMERYGLRPRDALHAAAALENGLTTIVSYDEDFDRIEGIRRREP